MTPLKLVNKLSLKQAKSWGYKSELEAHKDGYYTRPVSCTVKQASMEMELSINQTRELVNEWVNENLVSYCGYADLDTIYFKKEY